MSIKISSPLTGEIVFGEDAIIRFPEGMLGLPLFKRYLLLDAPEIRPFLRLQCIDEPSISFLLIDPLLFDPGFRDYVAERDPDEIYLENSAECMLYAVCKVATDGSDATANLVAPVIINNGKKVGYQLVLLDSPYDVRHSLLEASERKEA